MGTQPELVDKVPGPDWFTPTRLGFLTTLILFALYPGVFLGTHSFFYRDFGMFTYPVAYYTHESFWRGEVPLWNPLNNMGMPFLAQWNTTVCYPFSLIYMLFPLPSSLNFFCLAHLVLAAVGMYLLAYQWTQNRLAASIAGLSFALNGLMLNCLTWTSNLAALSWQPLVVLCVQRAWRQGSRSIVIAALVGAIQMLAGSPEIIIFTWLTLAILLLGESWIKPVQLWPSLRRLVVVVVLVATLAAAQLLPFLDLLWHSARDSASLAANDWPMAKWGWANYVVPLFHGSHTLLGFYFLNGQSWTLSYYLGMGVLALALVGVWRVRRLTVWWLAGTVFAGMVLAPGQNGFVYTWLKQLVPLIGFARYPIKFVALTTFAIPLLAAYGFDSFWRRAGGNCQRSERCLLIFSVLLLIGVAATLTAAYRFPETGDSWSATWHSGISRAMFLVATVATVIALGRVQSMQNRGLLGLAMLGLMTFDVVTAERHQNPAVITKAFGPLELNMTFRPRLGESRAMLSQHARAFFGQADTADPLQYYVGVRGGLFANCNLLESIPKVEGFASLHLKEPADIITALYGSTNRTPGPLTDFLGVTQISASNNVFAWQQRSTGLLFATAGQRAVFAEQAEILEKISADEFDPRHIVYLPPAARAEIAGVDSSDAKITSQQFAAHHIRLTVKTPTPTMVVVAQTFYHNWHAFVDAKPVPLWRANYAFQAVKVPAGQHEVVLIYQDRAFRSGTIISALTLTACLTYLLAFRPGPSTLEAHSP